MVHPLTEQFYRRLGTIHLTSWHVQIINKHNLKSQKNKSLRGPNATTIEKGTKS